MEKYINEKGETVVIADMDSFRLIHAIAKYAELNGKEHPIVKALKEEAFKRLAK